ncbi:MAG: hotdog fold thioesterase [Cyclobacteriaceae bacterium]|nr:hotdog fold thioesterase [Cyclobacteriaceae bacterium HetDA_MAG_MS6]
MFPEGLSFKALNDFSDGSMVSHLGIEFIELGKDYLKAKMPVDHRTKQPLGLLHGGASVVLAETLGSGAASLVLDAKKQYAVGLEINANHIKSVKTGFVYGTAKPLHIGSKTHVWEVKIKNEADSLVCVSRITMAVLDLKK